MFENFGLEVATRFVDFSKDSSVADQMQGLAPARTVPTWEISEDVVLWDSLAIAEELASRVPQAGHWPSDPDARALARVLVSEMHSGFFALREACPMNLVTGYADFEPDEALRRDLDRLEVIWAQARRRFGSDGPWLFGQYSLADVFFAPVATRIATYDLPVSEAASRYVAAHLADPAFRRWRAIGCVSEKILPWYRQDLPERAWPGPKPVAAEAVDDGQPENTACPYSGEPPRYVAQIDGRIFGFCNRTCRDKTVFDAAAFPGFMKIYQT